MSEVNNKRILSIDILRGIIMIIMALDHTRDYFSNFSHNPTDLQYASTPMFFTRWITHFCAPIFIFLSGASAHLSLSRGKTKSEASIFLLKRGFWLLLLEVTVVRTGWMFNLDVLHPVGQVIWAIGWSMICLATLIHLPRWLILTVSLAMIFGHNLLDGIHAETFGDNALLWRVVHEFGYTPFGDDAGLMIIYPLVPWIGVMAAGYCFGAIMQLEQQKRDKALYRLGIGAIVLFIALRFTNVYGDASKWELQTHWWRTVLSFLNCSKYPPSLLYLLMTIGPAITVLPLLEKANNKLTNIFSIYGKVPMFYYILHIYLIHGIAILVAVMMNVPTDYFTDSEKIFSPKPGWGFGLNIVYCFWLLAVSLLYLPCRWFANIKATHKKWWLSYL